MLILEQKIQVKWTNKNKSWYVSKGYKFTRINDIFEVDIVDLSFGSHKKVEVNCDYCGKHFYKEYREYLKGHQSGKDCCSSCQKIKSKEICQEKYGVDNVFQLDWVKNKSAQTNIEKYGDPNIAHGSLHYKIIETNMRKYGVPFSTQAPEVIKKMRESLYKNGNVPSSKAEQVMCKELVELYGEDNCFPGYNIDLINLDCLLIVNGIKIDIEYDGYFWHKDRQEKDKRRNYFLIRNGYKVIRFIAENKVPSKDDLIFYINYLLKNEEDILWIYLDVDV